MAYLEELLPEFRQGAKIRIKSWLEDFYLQIKDGIITFQNKLPYNLTLVDLKSDSWEFYQEPEPDWEYIIKNKCLCWFWCKYEERKIAGYLADYDSYNSQFGRYNGKNVAVTYFDYCQPVSRDEVTFYDELINDAKSKA